jgi:hypothetical protein
MAKAKKRATKSSARAKSAKKKAVAAKKSSAKRAVPPKKAAKKAAPKSAPPAAKKTEARANTATPARKAVEHVTVKPQRPEPPAPKQPAPKQPVEQNNLSPDSKRKLAAQHMWDLVQAKKQRTAQTPAWQTIEHHDHPAPRSSPDLSSDQGGSSMPPEMPGHRDRGTG